MNDLTFELAARRVHQNLPHPEKVLLPVGQICPTHVPAQLLHGSQNDYFNLGDDLQTHSALRALGELQLVNRETPETWPSDAVVLMAGYYDWRRVGTCPTKAQVLLVSTHLWQPMWEQFRGRRQWLLDMVKAQGFPAMCRDIATRDFLRSMGVDAEFGGCLTLSFEPYAGERSGELAFDIASNLPGFDHRKADSNIGKLSFDERRPFIEAHLQAISSAKMIVTSKLHVYLPAVAAGTPVELRRENWTDADIARFSGYRIEENSAAKRDLNVLTGAHLKSLHYDYIDIGTSDFDVADGLFITDKRYLLVEPMQEYLDRLPSGDHIVKECAACSDFDGFLDLHYVPPAAVQDLGLPQWVKGCNKLNEKHPILVDLLARRGQGLDIIEVRKVPTMRFASLLTKHGASSAGYIKIDTEGHDHIILEQIAQCILRGNFICDRIKVEYIRGRYNNNTEQLDRSVYALRKVFPNFCFDSENLTIWR